jgi:hypothetical protein
MILMTEISFGETEPVGSSFFGGGEGSASFANYASIRPGLTRNYGSAKNGKNVGDGHDRNQRLKE